MKNLIKITDGIDLNLIGRRVLFVLKNFRVGTVFLYFTLMLLEFVKLSVIMATVVPEIFTNVNPFVNPS